MLPSLKPVTLTWRHAETYAVQKGHSDHSTQTLTDMKASFPALAAAAIILAFGAPASAQDFTAHESISFFITSVGPGNGADLGGLEGADAHCQTLAATAGADDKTWHAYLSAAPAGDEPAVNARDRIGDGPWHNSRGVLIAEDVEQLHGEEVNLNKEASLSEKGQPVNGRGDQPNMHDILTGSNADGTLFTGESDTTCSNWTSSGEGSARVGHHDRTGGGDDPTSWNSAHGSSGCSQPDLVGTGGNGLYYCFATPAGSRE